MRIVIDMQAVQVCSSTIDSDIFPLVQAMVHNRGEHQIILALNGLYPDSIQALRAAFSGLLTRENICVWFAPDYTSEPESHWRYAVAERIREAFIINLRPDVVFTTRFSGNHSEELLSDKCVVSANSGNEAFGVLNQVKNIRSADMLLLTQSKVPALNNLGIVTVSAHMLKTEAGGNNVNAQARTLLEMFEQATPFQEPELTTDKRLKLAYVSPLPPERSGIAEFSIELLPELANYYDIDVILAQHKLIAPWVSANCGIKSVNYFLQNAHLYDRVIYHFGNSPFHQHMFGLLAQVPGIVVLHDFCLGDIYHYLEAKAIIPHALSKAVYLSQGYEALSERFQEGRLGEVVNQYPCNIELLQQAHNVIVHSQHSLQLAKQWYSHKFSEDWAVVPLLRSPDSGIDRIRARKLLGLPSDQFIVCSFGILGATKLNHLLLDAWLNSQLAQNCMLLFVGATQEDEYCKQLSLTIENSGLAKNIRITGWVEMATFKNYLAAADIAVQFRAFSRGETSGAVLDCMSHSLPTIVNAYGSFAELPTDAVWMLPETFEQSQLVMALETLCQDREKRNSLGNRAQKTIQLHHAPSVCARL